MQDKDVFVGLSAKPVKVSKFSDLTDLRVGGIRGFRYLSIDELVHNTN